VRLVACSNCHTQYDVTNVAAKKFPCRCGQTLENVDLAAVEARVQRCGSCGGSVGGDEVACSYCGSPIDRDAEKRGSLICPECYARCADDSRFCTACGVGFHPEPVTLDVPERMCPVCSRLMEAQQVAGIGLNECSACGGLWVPGDSFELLVDRAIEARRNATPEQLRALDPRVRGANPARQKIAYRHCPVCNAYMHRRNYRKSSGIIIDRCHEHGTWLDADELEQIAGFLMTAGAPLPPERTAAQRTAAAAIAIAEAKHIKHGMDDRNRSFGSLLDTLTRLLD
jgi:Zn-finger nucleic acid-binding protein